MASLINIKSEEVVNLLPRHIAGRHPSSSELVLNDSRVSRSHAVFLWDGQSWTIEDCSSNGTYLNGNRLTKHQIRTLHPGDEIGFVKPDENVWKVRSVDAPVDMLIPQTQGAALLKLEGFTVLPSEEAPLVSLYRSVQGHWVCETSSASNILKNGNKVSAGEHIWRFVEGVTCEETEQMHEDLLLDLSQIAVKFDVSQNEEHVSVEVHAGDSVFSLGERNHHYLILMLARKYREDKAAGLGTKELGWMDKDLLAQMLCMSEVNINMYIYRFRKQLIDALPKDISFAQLIERRHCEVRLNCDNVAIEGGLEI